MPGHSLSPVAFSTTPSPIYNDLQNDCSRGTMVGNQCSGWCARQVKNMMKKKALKHYSKCICQARKCAVLCHAQYMLVWGCMGQYLPLHRSKALFRESCEFNGAFSMGCQQLLCTLRESSKLQLSQNLPMFALIDARTGLDVSASQNLRAVICVKWIV